MLFTLLLLTACSNTEPAAQKGEESEKATRMENKEKDTLVYDFKGQKVEVELKK